MSREVTWEIAPPAPSPNIRINPERLKRLAEIGAEVAQILEEVTAELDTERAVEEQQPKAENGTSRGTEQGAYLRGLKNSLQVSVAGLQRASRSSLESGPTESSPPAADQL